MQSFSIKKFNIMFIITFQQRFIKCIFQTVFLTIENKTQFKKNNKVFSQNRTFIEKSKNISL